MDYVQQINQIVSFANTAVEAATLTSVHPPIGNTKLNTFMGGLGIVQATIVAGNLQLAYSQLSTGLSLCDGEESPADLVEGTARAELASSIQVLMAAIMSDNGRTDGGKFAALKSKGRL